MRNLVQSTTLLLLLLLSSCDPEMVYDQYVQTDDGLWKWQDAKEFKIEMSDTLTMHNIYIQLRHTTEYPMSNLYLFVHVKSPTGQLLKDTVNIVLANPDGRWIGKGAGNLRELKLLYRKNVKFALSGTYTFTLEQGMRTPSLPVTDLGIRIERIKSD